MVLSTVLGLLLASADADLKIAPENHVDEETMAVLRDWEARFKTIKSLYLEFEVTTVDEVWRETVVRRGSARYREPHEARVDYASNNRNFSESWVLKAASDCWCAEGKSKSIQMFDWKAEDVEWALRYHPLSFFTVRFEVERLLKNFRVVRLDANDASIRVELEGLPEPKRRLFQFGDSFRAKQVTIELDKESLMPNAIVVADDSKRQTTLNVTSAHRDVAIESSDFELKIPKGWRVVP